MADNVFFGEGKVSADINVVPFEIAGTGTDGGVGLTEEFVGGGVAGEPVGGEIGVLTGGDAADGVSGAFYFGGGFGGFPLK